MHAIKLSSCVLAAALIASTAYAQSNRWYRPYVKGVAAFDAARYDEAVTLL